MMKKIEGKSLILDQSKTSPARFEEKVRKFLALGLDTWVSITRPGHHHDKNFMEIKKNVMKDKKTFF
jgi:hypothetical protein